MASTLCNLRQCDGNGDGDKNFFFNNLLFIHNQIHFTPPAYDISSHIIHHQNDEKWKTQKDLKNGDFCGLKSASPPTIFLAFCRSTTSVARGGLQILQMSVN